MKNKTHIRSTSCNRKLRQIEYYSLNTTTYIDLWPKKFGCSVYVVSTVKKLSRAYFHVKQRKRKENRFLEYLIWRPDVTAFQTKHVQLIKIHWYIFHQRMVVQFWDLIETRNFVSGLETDKRICSMKIKATIFLVHFPNVHYCLST